MARCGCAGGSGTCSCYVVGAASVSVTGTGTATNPYVVSFDAEASPTVITVEDSDSLLLEITGDGSGGDPYVITGTAITVDPAWQNYTGTWDTTGTAPSVGNGVLELQWQGGDQIRHFKASLIFGTTTSAGTGHWKFPMPPDMDPDDPNNFDLVVYDSTGDAFYFGKTGKTDANYTRLYIDNGNAGGPLEPLNGTTPITFNTNDTIVVKGWYRPLI